MKNNTFKQCITASILSLLIVCMVHAYEYVYPVGHMENDGLKILLLYQKSAHHVELWQWDPVSQEAGKALLSSFTPAGIAQLPDNLGYSFIDNDTLRVAYTAKRSPKLIPLYEPLYDFTTVQWITQTQCILSAKEHDTYGIYIIHTEGDCIELIHDIDTDYRYPTCYANDIYYIEAHKGNHAVIHAIVPREAYEEPTLLTIAESSDRRRCALQNKHTLVDCGAHSIAFLRMSNAHEGSYLEYPSTLDRHAQEIPFTYHLITCDDNNVWHDKQLFSFSIPATFLIDPHERLHESILPFLPQRIAHIIYYFDCPSGTLATSLYAYSLTTQQTQEVAHSPHSLMGIYQHKDCIWHGGTLLEQSSLDMAPRAWVNDLGMFLVSMPTMKE